MPVINSKPLSPILLPDITTCPLQGNWVKGEGSLGAIVVLVGEAPGEEEAKRKRPFVGKSGKELTMYLSTFTQIARSVCYITNVVKVRPPENRDPTQEEVEWFSPCLQKELDEIQPRFIGAIGKVSASWFRGRNVNMEKEHGIPFTWGRYDAEVMPLYHPAYGLHNTRMMQQIIWDFTDFGEMVRGRYTMEINEVKDIHYELYRG